MKTTMTSCLAGLALLISAGSLLAHHSLANFDLTEAVRVRGTVVRLHVISPHSFLYVEERLPDGQVRRWAVEGPAGWQLARRNMTDALKPGDVVEVCGYAPKEATMWQIANPDPFAVSLPGRLLNGESLVMPDGRLESWGDYGTHKCFPPEYRDQHSR